MAGVYWGYKRGCKDILFRQGLFGFLSVLEIYAAAMLIVYTRCLAIAINSKQVFDDLARLGAGPRYLFGAVREQSGKIYLIPSGIGFALMYILYLMIMYANDGSFTKTNIKRKNTHILS